MTDTFQQMLRDGFARYARESYAPKLRHAALVSRLAYRDDAWRDFAELGWLALRLPEAHGGLDADAAIVGAMMETVGRNLLLEPLLASAIIGAGALLRAPADVQAEMLPGLADGSRILALAYDGDAVVADDALSGEMVGVLHGDVADRIVVAVAAADGGLFLIDPSTPEVARECYRLVDGRGAATLRFDAAVARRIGDPAALQQTMHEQAVALLAEIFGSADHLVDATAGYLQVRKQFGRTLGSYQALQHRMSEMAMLREEIAALTAAAQHALGEPEPARSRTINGSAAYILSAARTIANEAVQLHGGMGITEELDISHHFRRQMVIAALLGGRDRRIEQFIAASEAR